MRYKLLGATGLRVSEVALGTATFGTAWGWGADSAQSRAIFEGFVSAGGNFFDCAEGYQAGQSEELLGAFVHANRDDFVIGTKYSGGVGTPSLSRTGNSRKAMVLALEGSLRRLRTDHVDVFSVHFADGMTPTEEILRGFDEVVRAGKARYVGFSDFPAWRVARGAAIADFRGWPTIVSIQVEYSLLERSAERELLPMADALGLTATLWAVLGGGLLSGKYRWRETEGRLNKGGGRILSEDRPFRTRILDALAGVATARGITPSQAAIAWIRTRWRDRPPAMIPIVGARTPAQLDENLGALSIRLEPEDVTALDAASEVPAGFPHEWLSSDTVRALGSAGRWNDIDKPGRGVA